MNSRYAEQGPMRGLDTRREDQVDTRDEDQTTAVAELLGRTEDALAGAEADFAAACENLEAAQDAHARAEVCRMVLDADGRVSRMKLDPMHDEEGDFVGFVVVRGEEMDGTPMPPLAQWSRPLVASHPEALSALMSTGRGWVTVDDCLHYLDHELHA